jgi:hypothetical protein
MLRDSGASQWHPSLHRDAKRQWHGINRGPDYTRAVCRRDRDDENSCLHWQGVLQTRHGARNCNDGLTVKKRPLRWFGQDTAVPIIRALGRSTPCSAACGGD